MRVAQSSYFRKGTKLHAFLLYACENSILGRTENLTAQSIGTKVFGRSPEYDLNEDNIVRVEARELRKRLDAYFRLEGRAEPIVIEIPKGSYVPAFRLREQAPGPEVTAVPPVRRRRLPAVPLLISLALVALAAAVWLLGSGRTPHPSDAVYRDLLGATGTRPDRQTLIVLSNPTLLMYYGSQTDQTTRMPQTYRAPEELKSTLGFILRPADKDAPYHLLSLVSHDYTGIGETVAAFHLGQLMQRLHRHARLTQSRFLNWDHAQQQDLVLLGGPVSNDWTYQNDSKSNFVFGSDGVQNTKPLPGEQSRYVVEGGYTSASASVEYGVVKMLTSPYGFKTLIFAGQTSAGTAGVAEFFSSQQKIEPVYRQIRAAAGAKPFPADWELLIRITVRDGLPLETAAIAVRPARVP